MQIVDTLIVTSLLFVLAADPKGGVSSSAGSPPLSASAAGVRPLAICPAGQKQNISCLANAGAVGPDGAVSVKKAKALLKNGTCPCQNPAGTMTGTIPASSDQP